MPTTTFRIEGMTCNNCAHHVQQALSSVTGVKSAQVSLEKKQAVVESEGPLDLTAAEKAVEEEGYKASLT